MSLPDTHWPPHVSRLWAARSVLVNLLAQRAASVPRDTEMVRASGDVACSICGEAYRFHPLDLDEPWLRIHCDGGRLKL